MLTATRVELLTARELLDQYADCLRVLSGACAHHKRASLEPLPKRYTLNKRYHLPFFYVKLGWVSRRFTRLSHEIQFRGVIMNFNRLPPWGDHLPPTWWGDWDERT